MSDDSVAGSNEVPISSNQSPKPSIKNYKRSIKNYWLNPRFQGKYIFWVSFTGLALILGNASVFYFYTKENYSLLVDLSPMTEQAKFQLYHELDTIVVYLIGANLIFLLITAVLGLLFSHRVAGPLYHFKRIFKEVKKGNLDARIHLRPKDEFKDVAAEFNEMMDAIKTGPSTPKKDVLDGS